MWGKVNSVMKSVAREKTQNIKICTKNTNFILVRAKRVFFALCSERNFFGKKKYEHEDMIFMKT